MTPPEEQHLQHALQITTRRHPKAVTLNICGFALGLFFMLGVLQVPSVARQLAQINLVIWTALVIIGGALTLMGIFHRNIDTGLLLEQAGEVAQGFGFTIYTLTAIAFQGRNISGAVILLAGCAVGSWCRFAQCTVERRKVRYSRAAGHTVVSRLVAEEKHK